LDYGCSLHHSGHLTSGDLRSHRIEVFHDIIRRAVKAQVDITLVELAEMLHLQRLAAREIA
jgi:hypothetical protein